MKQRKIVVIALALCLTVLGAVAWAGFGFPKASGLDVNDILSDPSGYTGEIAVRGGVMSVVPEKKLFNLIDYREYRGCRTVGCAAQRLSVVYQGDPPRKGEVVEVRGTIVQSAVGDGGFALEAAAVTARGAYK